MPAGLQTFDAVGDIELDTTDYTFKTLGKGETGTVNGSVTDSSITADTVVIPVYVTDMQENMTDLTSALCEVQTPIFTVSNGAIKWAFKDKMDLWRYSSGYRCSIGFIYGMWEK